MGAKRPTASDDRVHSIRKNVKPQHRLGAERLSGSEDQVNRLGVIGAKRRIGSEDQLHPRGHVGRNVLIPSASLLSTQTER